MNRRFLFPLISGYALSREGVEFVLRDKTHNPLGIKSYAPETDVKIRDNGAITITPAKGLETVLTAINTDNGDINIKGSNIAISKLKDIVGEEGAKTLINNLKTKGFIQQPTIERSKFSEADAKALISKGILAEVSPTDKSELRLVNPDAKIDADTMK